MVNATVKPVSVSPQSRARTRATSTPNGPAFRETLDEVLRPGPEVHIVQRGDSLSRICQNHLRCLGSSPSNRELYLAVQRVARANGLQNPDLILPGQRLDLSALQADSASPPSIGVRRTSARANTQATAASARLTKTAKTDGAGGSARAGALTGAFPARVDLTELVAAIFEGRTVRPASSAGPAQVNAALHAPSASPWASLLEGTARLSSGFGMRKDPFTGRPAFHAGVDLAVDKGTRIHPFDAGKVVFSGRKRGYGNVVIVRHGDGMDTVYGHNSVNLVKAGQWVTPETVLGKTGSTGRSTGPHLHFEVRRNGRAVNPLSVLADQSVQVAQAL